MKVNRNSKKSLIERDKRRKIKECGYKRRGEERRGEERKGEERKGEERREVRNDE